LQVIKSVRSTDGSLKYLWHLKNGQTIESIFFRLDATPHVCISSQVGCNVGCRFCETGKQSVLSNLSSDDIIAQVTGVIGDQQANLIERRFNSVILAGMGEPLHNYESVVGAAESMLSNGLTDRVTVTTSGVAPMIRELANSPISTLSVSLHATTNEVRSRLVPINRKYPIDEVVSAASVYREKTGHQVIMNYLLFDGLNDSDEDIVRLTKLLDPTLFAIKLKDWNSVSDTGLRSSSPERYRFFQERLLEYGFDAMICVSRGSDVGGGCGQLRSEHASISPIWKKRYQNSIVAQ
jgi:23S rRNA (adenine2503-C2)-methyltransferase